jgi:membrane-associated protein
MPARQFFIYNVIGGVLWTDGILLVGYTLAKRLSAVPNIDKYILPAVALIVLISVSPILVEFYRGWRARRRGLPTTKVADDPGPSGRHRA